MTPRLLLLPLVFALVATATLASPAGEDDTAAAEKEMVRDPATGKMVTAPEYGGTITFGTASEPAEFRSRAGAPGSRIPWMFTLEKLAHGGLGARQTAKRSAIPVSRRTSR